MNDTENIVAIDEDELGRECVKLPTATLRASHRAADMKRDVVELKAELDVIEADISKRVRAAPGKYGVDEKVTEKAVAAVIALQKEYQDKQREIRAAQYEQDLAQALVNALEHKKRSLTLLVELHGMGYFAAPKITERGKEAVDDLKRKQGFSRKREDREDRDE